MSKFKVGDRVKWDYESNAGNNISGVFDIIDENGGYYMIRLSGNRSARVNKLPKSMGDREFIAANSALNAKFKKGDRVIDLMFGRKGTVIKVCDDRHIAVKFDNGVFEKRIWSEPFRKLSNSVLNAKFKVGDVVEIVGSGLASKGWVGTVKSVGSGSGWNIKVQFPAGKYSNDYGEYREDELYKVRNSTATTNAVVRNALEARNAFGGSRGWDQSEIDEVKRKITSAGFAFSKIDNTVFADSKDGFLHIVLEKRSSFDPRIEIDTFQYAKFDDGSRAPFHSGKEIKKTVEDASKVDIASIARSIPKPPVFKKYKDGYIKSKNGVVRNALSWRAKNAKDADGKELKVGDKIKVRVDMNGLWDGGGVITALKPYRVVEYKDVFGHVNTTQENSVRKA